MAPFVGYGSWCSCNQNQIPTGCCASLKAHLQTLAEAVPDAWVCCHSKSAQEGHQARSIRKGFCTIRTWKTAHRTR